MNRGSELAVFNNRSVFETIVRADLYETPDLFGRGAGWIKRRGKRWVMEGPMPRLPDETDKRDRFQSVRARDTSTGTNWPGSADTDGLERRRSSLLIPSALTNIYGKYKILN